MITEYNLSKSKYCQGVQCPKMLWLEENMPDEATERASEAILANGQIVGETARNYFGEYELVDFSHNKKAMCQQTEKYIEDGVENIAEASFMCDGLYCAVDILHKDEDGWNIIEVKSSEKIRDEYIDDMAFQLYVVEKFGLRINKIFNMHIDKTYIRHGNLELERLFALEDCTELVRARADQVENNISMIRRYLSTEYDVEADHEIGIHCISPYECAFKNHCWKHLPQNSVFDIYGLNKKKMFELYDQGIVSFDDVMNHNVKLSDKQRLQVNTAVENRPDQIKVDAVAAFLNTLTYPIYHLDFETFMQAVPEFEGGQPYTQIPFQYSLHIEYEDGHLEHKEFLAKEGTDPRRTLAEQLCEDIPMGVCSLAYNMSFEKTVIKNLADQYPDLAEHLIDIRENMHDLMDPFKNGDYYNEAMKGSYSIKYVLPALYPGDPELDYHNLDEVHNGSEASAAFLTMAQKTPDEIRTLRANLLKYCGLDTYAMVKVLAKLREVVAHRSITR